MSAVEKAAEALAVRDAHVGYDSVADAKALDAAGLLRPDWATDEAERALRAKVEAISDGDMVVIRQDPDASDELDPDVAGSLAEWFGTLGKRVLVMILREDSDVTVEHEAIRPPWATGEAQAVLDVMPDLVTIIRAHGWDKVVTVREALRPFDAWLASQGRTP